MSAVLNLVPPDPQSGSTITVPPTIDDQPTTAVDRARFHEAEADRHADQEDHHRWEAARAYVDALDGGMTVRQLAEELGKGIAHVSYVSKAWRVHLGEQPGDRPRWNVAYQAAKGKRFKEQPPEGAPNPDDGDEKAWDDEEDSPEPPPRDVDPLEQITRLEDKIDKLMSEIYDLAVKNDIRDGGKSAFVSIRNNATFHLKDFK